MYTRIVVPLDGSRFSTRALKYASDLASRYQASLLLVQVVQPVRVIPPVDPTGLTNPAATSLTFEQASRQDSLNLARARRYLSRKARQMKALGVATAYQALEGDPADTIMKTARREKADLIIMATHGRSGFKRAILGSVADKVIRESGEPVLVVRPYRRRSSH